MAADDHDSLTDTLTLEYHGGRAATGRMDAYEVAKNITAFSDFVSVASRAVYGDKAKLNADIQAFKHESFDIEFLVNVGGAIATLTSSTPLSISDLMEHMKEAVKVWKHLKGSPPKSVKTVQGDENHAEVINQQNQSITINAGVVNIFSDHAAGKAVEQLFKKPLESDVETVKIQSKATSDALEVEQHDAACFVPVDIQIPPHDNEVKMSLSIESPVFTEGKKWKFNDGSNSFLAEIEDGDFLKLVNESKARFGKGDILVVRMRITQASSSKGLKVERTILEVIEHKQSPLQHDLSYEA